ncbi:MAG: acyloxyacyl hydrolase [Nitrospiraceae bacterium]
MNLYLISWGMVIVALFTLAPLLVQAEDAQSLSVGVRAGFSGMSPIGELETEHFHQYDVMAIFELPWEWYSQSGWGVGTRLLTSAGALRAAGETGFIGTLVPGFSFGKKDGWVSLELGGGAALLSEYKFGSQNMGGPFQFVWDVGVRSKIYRGVGVAYWFQHMSDATIYGDNGRGVDLHMVGVTYRY